MTPLGIKGRVGRSFLTAHVLSSPDGGAVRPDKAATRCITAFIGDAQASPLHEMQRLYWATIVRINLQRFVAQAYMA
jgi:hypothetical protein